MEWRSLYRDHRLLLAAGVYLMLVVMGVVFVSSNQRSSEMERLSVEAAERERWLNQGPKHPHAAAHFGMYVFRPTDPLAWVETGVTPFLGTTLWLEAHRQNEPAFRPADESGSMQRFGVLDLATVLTVFAPLLLILIFHDRLSSERERQTLPWLICQGIGPSALFAGKLVAALVVVFLFLAMAVVPAAVLGAGAGGGPGWQTLGRGLVMTLGFGGFLSFFALLSLTVSAFFRSSVTAAGMLLGFWMLGFLVAPRVLSDLVARWDPPPTRFEFQMALQEDLDQRESLQSRLAAERQRLEAEFGSAETQDWPVNFRAVSLQFGEEHSQVVSDFHYGNLFDLFERQNNEKILWSWIFPTLAVRQISMAMAGTDLQHFRHFLEQGEDYRRRIQRLMNDDLYLNPEEDGQPYLADRDLWEKLPPWEFQAVSWADSMKGLGPSTSVLLGWNLFLPLLGWMGTARMFRRP